MPVGRVSEPAGRPSRLYQLIFASFELGVPMRVAAAGRRQVMPDDHSKVVPPLPIPNRTVKRLCADDSEQLACESRLSSGFY